MFEGDERDKIYYKPNKIYPVCESKYFEKDIAEEDVDGLTQINNINYISVNGFINNSNIQKFITRDEIEMDVSTVSRVANSKYVDTPYGTKLIKEFFSESMTNDQGEEVSTREIKKILEMVIEEENKKKIE